MLLKGIKKEFILPLQIKGSAEMTARLKAVKDCSGSVVEAS